MNLIVKPATNGSRGVDTVTRFSASLAAQVKAAGFDFVVRYLGALTTTERDRILGAGLALLAVGYSRRPGWRPTAEMGAADGVLAVSRARGCGLPSGLSLFCDLEGPAGTASDCIGYVNGWAHVVQDAGYLAGLYVGYGVPLTARQLYYSLAVTGYWDSCSINPLVEVRGYQMRQLSPPNQHAFGTLIDIDVIQTDAKGDTPHWLIAQGE